MRRLLVPLGAVLAVACGFPDVAYLPDDGGDDGSSSGDVTAGPDAGGEGSTGHEGGGDDGTTGDATQDARGDAAGDGPGDATGDATGDAAADAIVDAIGDGAGDATADAASDAIADAVADALADVAPDALEAGTDASGVCDQDQDGYRSTAGGCNGTDCCDTDKQAHPGVTAFFTTADHCGSFDYNCDGTMEGQYTVNLACSGTPALGCQGGSGFTASPGCGNPGAFGTCQANGLLNCAPGSLLTETQGCR